MLLATDFGEPMNLMLTGIIVVCLILTGAYLFRGTKNDD